MADLKTPEFNPVPPKIPNFLNLEGSDNYMPIWRFSETQLRQMADKWAEILILEAKRRREKYNKERSEREAKKDEAWSDLGNTLRDMADPNQEI